MMKNLKSINKWLIFLAAVASFSFSSCKKGWWGYDEGNGGGGNGGGENTNFDVKGTMYYQNCGLGIYDNLWIRTDDGKILQPCEAKSLMCVPPLHLKEGDRVELNYSQFKGAYPSFSPFCRMASFPFTKASINFISKIETTDCSLVSFPANYLDLPSNVFIKSARIEGSYLKLKIGFSGCNNETSRFKLVATPTEKSNVLTYEVKVIDDSQLPVLCEAYFEEEVCFDIAPFKYLIDGFIKVKIVGFENELTY
jgi:hypothetical protein